MRSFHGRSLRSRSPLQDALADRLRSNTGANAQQWRVNYAKARTCLTATGQYEHIQRRQPERQQENQEWGVVVVLFEPGRRTAGAGPLEPNRKLIDEGEGTDASPAVEADQDNE